MSYEESAGVILLEDMETEDLRFAYSALQTNKIGKLQDIATERLVKIFNIAILFRTEELHEQIYQELMVRASFVTNELLQ